MIQTLGQYGFKWLLASFQDKIAANKMWWNFSIAEATACDSISIATYPFCVSVRALLAK